MSASASIIASCDALVTYLNAIQTPPAPPVTVPPTPAAVNPFDPFTFTAYRDYAPYFQLIHHQTRQNTIHPGKHEIKGNRSVRHDNAFHRRMTDVPLVPQRNIFHPGHRKAPQQTR